MDQPLKLLCDQIMEWWYRNGGRPEPPFVTLALKLLQEDAYASSYAAADAYAAANPRPMGVQQAESAKGEVPCTCWQDMGGAAISPSPLCRVHGEGMAPDAPRTVGIAPGPVLEAVTDGVLADLKADAEIAADQQPTDHVENDFH
jgi:hypothetical protein